jgi:hypothetical protein
MGFSVDQHYQRTFARSQFSVSRFSLIDSVGTSECAPHMGASLASEHVHGIHPRSYNHKKPTLSIEIID